jgi:hypothetical protein
MKASGKFNEMIKKRWRAQVMNLSNPIRVLAIGKIMA